jgi:hypothetical protein
MTEGAIVRPVLLAFFGAAAFLVWTLAHQHTRSACYGYSHFAPWDVIALASIAAVDSAAIVGLRIRSARGRPSHPAVAGYVIEIAVTAALSAVAIWAAVLVSGAVSCSGG